MDLCCHIFAAFMNTKLFVTATIQTTPIPQQFFYGYIRIFTIIQLILLSQ